MLSPSHKISPPKWMQNPDLIHILDILNHDNINARLVGGCIRNHFFNKPIYDIDIACSLKVEDIIERLKNANIQIILTGIEHGTITAHLNGQNFEITTLRMDIATDGRHAKIAYTDNWFEDASRRDFTINALYADRDGSIYDPLGNGLNDIHDKVVRFIDDPHHRIQEDYLRILRFFRFYAQYHHNDTPDDASYQACINNKDGLDQLSDERICDELFKILNDDTCYRAIDLMQTSHILKMNDNNAASALRALSALQTQLDRINIPARYFTTGISKKYIKNKKILKFLNALDLFINSWDGRIKQALYHYNREVVIQGLLILKSTGGRDISDIMIADAIALPIPQFPIIAHDIMTAFNLCEGPNVGQYMRKAEIIWLNHDCALNRDQIIDLMRG